MKFEEIIQAFREGKPITRINGWSKGFKGIDKEWGDEIFSAEDILGEDWEIVEEHQ
jgi:hypothetical protein